MFFEPSIHEIPGAMVVFCALILHVGVLGYWVSRLLGLRHGDAWVQVTYVSGLGLAALTMELLVLGHLGLLTRGAMLVSSVVLAGWVAWNYRWIGVRLEGAARQVWADSRPDWVLGISCVVVIVAAFVSGLRPPFMTDEVQYHWAAPVFWAEQEGWVRSPYRLTNGFALTQVLYTFSAVFSNATAAHWTHTLFLLFMLSGCGALAKSYGARPLAGVAACLAVPVIVGQSSVAYNDVAAASLAVGAYAVLLSFDREKRQSASVLLSAGVLLAAAVSAKSFLIFAAPGAALLAGWGLVQSGVSSIGAMRHVAVLLTPIVLTIGMWMGHTYSLTGKVWEGISGDYFVESREDPMWQTGGAVGRIPSAVDVAGLPLVPVYTSVLGQREPYGGRTGPLLLVFVPLSLVLGRDLPAEQRRRLWWLMVAAGAYYFLLGPLMIKTRYHTFVWAILAAVAAGGYCWSDAVDRPRVRRAIGIAFLVLVWIGMADGVRRMMQGLILPLPIT